ncbi:PREDICTED: ran GTPase-activating protein 1-like [Nicrophorus vespilloides]|uniref:Ran GTPase-activating protein 1-like n=1 Tax=Nicrophorus vespilloides TaxID=110193 RepID=A0ABM1MWT7_NICVS|nr:PREDICTED: ran GTPase-activating protein 1-like [Nicrophorus vespilloides]
MANTNVDTLIAAFDKADIVNGVSFAGKGLKLNNADDAKDIIEAIKSRKVLEFLNLEGNTLGIEAAEAISKALETHSEFKRALWKDLFTGRMKDEIPICLEHLGNGLVASSARLTELDLSDNAFGPIGVKGLASLLRSSCCFALQELRLNNNGLGITGGKLLANALLDCHKFSAESGKPLQLKVFIAGRNRLENEGAQSLASVFKTIGTLEEIQMPQNGIYHVGITALSEAFKVNKNLKILNLNDNTIGPVGAKALAKALPNLESLKTINFGDCLLKTKGAIALAECLSNCDKLEELILSFNEIKTDGAVEVLYALKEKDNLKKISLNGNKFGCEGTERIQEMVSAMNVEDMLDEFDDDEGDDDDEEQSDEDDDEEEEEEDSEDTIAVSFKTYGQFVQDPTPENFLGLGDNRETVILNAVKESTGDYVDNCIKGIFSAASVYAKSKDSVQAVALKCCESLFIEMFAWCSKNDKLSFLNNLILINLGLIKGEDKKFTVPWNIESCLCALEMLVKRNYFPATTKDALKVFLKKDIDNKKDYTKAKQKLLLMLN